MNPTIQQAIDVVDQAYLNLSLASNAALTANIVVDAEEMDVRLLKLKTKALVRRSRDFVRDYAED
jgi:hypothetical protein